MTGGKHQAVRGKAFPGRGKSRCSGGGEAACTVEEQRAAWRVGRSAGWGQGQPARALQAPARQVSSLFFLTDTVAVNPRSFGRHSVQFFSLGKCVWRRWFCGMTQQPGLPVFLIYPFKKGSECFDALGSLLDSKNTNRVE